MGVTHQCNYEILFNKKYEQFSGPLESECSVHSPFRSGTHAPVALNARNKVGHQIRPWNRDSNSDCDPSAAWL